MDDQPNDMTGRTRDGRGRFDRDPETAKRDAQAAALRARSMSYQAIADELGMSRSAAFDAVKRALADTLAEPAEAARALELERLDTALGAVMRVLETEHVVIQHGRVVELDGKPVPDDAPVLQAVDRIVKLSESRRKLLGLDAATKLDVSGDVRYEVVGVDVDDLT